AGSEPGPAMSVLLANMLPALASSGMRTFDYQGANTPSIAEFKRRMGARLVSYYGIEKCTRPELIVFERLRTLYPRR
ncbi:MAG TPA: hypothetical protein VFG50_03460, partial [Rhodothermales bacterium]|nr:hypothetical protein [Rhodothermales bacterium]